MGQCQISLKLLTMNHKRGPSLGRLHSIRRSKNDSFKRRTRASSSLLVRRTYTMTDGGVQLSGYIDIKQPAKVKGRNLKSWKKKWVILQEMSIRSAGGRSAAKVDVYADERTSQASPADKHTFILEFVTEVRTAKSKTHDHAFEVVEKEPVLLLSGATEMESQTWVSALRKIFWPGQKHCGDSFAVAILSNEHTQRLVLHGVFTMTVNPESLSIRSERHNSYEWSLSTLKRFHMEKDAVKPEVELLIIESGPRSESGEAIFRFTSDNVGKILDSIKQNIFIAMKQKQSNSSPKLQSSMTTQSSTGSDERSRADTNSSVEKRFMELLENNATGPNLMHGKMAPESTETKPEVGDERPPALPKKKKSIVTFDETLSSNSKPTVDLLSTPSEVPISENDSSDYHKIELNTPKKSKPFGIISAFTIANADSGTTRVLLDERGYSHVDISDCTPAVVDSDKVRSVSNVSSHSSVSFRSVSVGSRDSGILNTAADIMNLEQTEQGRRSHRSTLSFDSAVSTSSVMDQFDVSKVMVSNSTNLTVEIEEIELTADELEASHYGVIDDVCIQKEPPKGENSIYSDIPAGNADAVEKTIKKSNSAGNMKTSVFYEYEESFNVIRKKNLVKHLGMDPTVDPLSVAPSLPERPSSNRIRRKNYSTDKKRFTLPFRIKRDKKTRERAASISSSSSGGSEATEKKAELTLKAWPLGNKSTIVDNESLYHPMAIQRFLTDDDGTVGPKKRERSSSLNLNTDVALKRPSVGSTDKENAIWKHNRNVSMQIDTMSYISDNSVMNKTAINGGDLSLMHELLCGNNRNETLLGFNSTAVDNSFHFDDDDEPIYAEVEPACRSPGDIEDENPFPNLTTWTPHDVSDVAEVSELNETVFENKTLVENKQGRDLFNQGFVCEEVDKEKGNTSVDTMTASENLLIDISISESSQNSTVAFDIFRLGIGPNVLNSQPLVPVSTNVYHNLSQSISMSLEPVRNTGTGSTFAHAQEDEYMDMSACKNESVYVMPSMMQQSESN